MAAQLHDHSPREYGAPAGIRLVTALQRSGLELFNAVQAASEGAALGLTRVHTNMLLHQLAAAGWVTRVKRDSTQSTTRRPKRPRLTRSPLGPRLSPLPRSAIGRLSSIGG